jgi:hypothetical protein
LFVADRRRKLHEPWCLVSSQLSVTINCNAQLLALKERLFELTGMPVNQQRLFNITSYTATINVREYSGAAPSSFPQPLCLL